MLSTVTGLGSVAVPVERGSWTSSSCLVCIAWIEVRAAVTCSSDIAMISPSMTDLCMSFEGRSLVRSSHNSLRSNDAKVGLLTVLLLEPDRECILLCTYVYRLLIRFFLVFFGFSLLGLRFGCAVLVVDVYREI